MAGIMMGDFKTLDEIKEYLDNGGYVDYSSFSFSANWYGCTAGCCEDQFKTVEDSMKVLITIEDDPTLWSAE